MASRSACSSGNRSSSVGGNCVLPLLLLFGAALIPFSSPVNVAAWTRNAPEGQQSATLLLIVVCCPTTPQLALLADCCLLCCCWLLLLAGWCGKWQGGMATTTTISKSKPASATQQLNLLGLGAWRQYFLLRREHNYYHLVRLLLLSFFHKRAQRAEL